MLQFDVFHMNSSVVWRAHAHSLADLSTYKDHMFANGECFEKQDARDCEQGTRNQRKFIIFVSKNLYNKRNSFGQWKNGVFFAVIVVLIENVWRTDRSYVWSKGYSEKSNPN